MKTMQMKKILLFLLTITLTFSCSSDDNTDGSRKRGTKLKSERTLVNSFGEKGNYRAYGEIDEYFYGSNDFVIEIRNISVGGGRETANTTSFFYEGNDVVRVFHKNISYGGEIDELLTYKNGLIVKSTIKFGSEIEIEYYTYDSSKNLLKTEAYNSDNQMLYKYFFEYRNGNLAKRVETYPSSEKNTITVYEYDDKHDPRKNILPEAFRKRWAANKNNVIRENNNVVKYEYNADGYPTRKVDRSNDIISFYEYY